MRFHYADRHRAAVCFTRLNERWSHSVCVVTHYSVIMHSSGMRLEREDPPPFSLPEPTALQPQTSAEGTPRSTYTAAIWALYEAHVG